MLFFSPSVIINLILVVEPFLPGRAPEFVLIKRINFLASLIAKCMTVLADLARAIYAANC